MSSAASLIGVSSETDVGAFDYGEALSKSLLYFEAQRSGRLPYNQRVTWRDHSGLTDGLEQGVDLVGGYHDAGDHVKFGLPMAFTVTMLPWSVIEYGDSLASTGELSHALEAIKWGTDYFIKAHTSPNVLWAEVGDGDTDRYCWQRPEDMTTSRRAFKIDENNPGSDLARETAAAMAAASIVFRTTNPHYSHLLLHHAQQLFEFGDKYRGKYDESLRVVKSYYASVSGYMDELLWGATWLSRATDNDHYISYVVDMAHQLGGLSWAMSEFSWDVKFAGVQLLASMCHEGTVTPDEMIVFAKSQIDYILGTNPMKTSYLVGYGPKYPTRVHHRGASIASDKEYKGFIGCTQGYDYWYGRSEPNSNRGLHV
uniref:Endoglucanase n=1 Tax=Brassica oleracea var. oleracea TaxID=109376 RepID=A0A0D2ZTG5_BRAOL